MKNTTLIAIIAAAALIIAGVAIVLTNENNSNNDKDTIVVTMGWQKDMLDTICDGQLNVVQMLADGVSPHEEYSTPSNVISLHSASIYFEIGSGVEWEEEFFSDVKADLPSSLTIVNCNDSIEYTALVNPEAEEGSSETDPHIWTSPEILKEIAAVALEQLITSYPEYKDVFTTGYDSYIGEVDHAEDYIANALSNIASGQTVVVWHPAWQYFLCQYLGMDMVGIEVGGEVEMEDVSSKMAGCSILYSSPFDEGAEFADALSEGYGITVKLVNPTASNILSELMKFADYLKNDLSSE